MIHTTPPTSWFYQPHTINPPTTPSLTPGNRINLYIIPWVVKYIKKILHHTARVFMILGVYIEGVCDVTHFLHPEYDYSQSESLHNITYTLTLS